MYTFLFWEKIKKKTSRYVDFCLEFQILRLLDIQLLGILEVQIFRGSIVVNSLMSAQHHWSWNPLAQNPLPRIILDNNIPMRGTCSRRQKKRSNHCLLAAVTELPTVVLVCSGCHHKILQNECLKHILFLLSVQEARHLKVSAGLISSDRWLSSHYVFTWLSVCECMCLAS